MPRGRERREQLFCSLASASWARGSPFPTGKTDRLKLATAFSAPEFVDRHSYTLLTADCPNMPTSRARVTESLVRLNLPGLRVALLPGHPGPALWTLPGEARYTPRVTRRGPAARADTVASGTASGLVATHEAATPAGSHSHSSPCPGPLAPRTGSISKWHYSSSHFLALLDSKSAMVSSQRDSIASAAGPPYRSTNTSPFIVARLTSSSKGISPTTESANSEQ